MDPILVSTPQPETKSIRSFLLPLLLTAVVILSGISIFFIYQNLQLQKQITALQNTPIPPSPAEALAKEGTANWKTFTSKAYSFSLKYPNTWSINTPPPSGNFETSGLLHLYATDESPISFELEVMPLQNTTLQLQLESVEDYTWNKQYKKSKIIIDGSEATILSGIIEDKPRGVAIVATNKFLYKLSSVVWDDIENLRQILSTFTFLDNEKTSTTYTCPSNGWVDCMPGPDTKPECSTEAMTWYKTNCPDFKGGAL